MSIEKLRPSFTFTEDRIKELQAVVPEAFADGKINWETLSEALGNYLEDPEQEHFGLTWPGKRDARRLAALPSKGALVPQPGEGINEETTHNIFIEGDNLEVLKLMKKSYAGRIKMIYIDPPYNTGNDFIYPDDYSEPLEAYLRRTQQVDEAGLLLTTNTRASGRFHSNWLNMMYPRLILARNLLRDDGFIFVSIDNNEVHHLRAILDEVFGEGNYLALVANVNNPKGRSDDKFVPTAHEYLLIYRKSEFAFLGGWEPGDNVLRRYNKIDDKGKKYREIDLRKTGDADRREDRPNMFYYFLLDSDTGSFYPSREEEIPDGYIQIKPVRKDGVDGRWRWELDTAVSRLDRLIPKLMPVRKVWTVIEMDYLDHDEKIKPTSAWTKKDFNSERGSEQFIELGFKKEIFPRPKPVGLLRHILELATYSDENHIVLDFFAGSGTTAQAIIELNKEGYKSIAAICKDRIRRVGNNITSKPQELYDYIDSENSLDIGFTSYKLAQSNYKDWQPYTGRESPQLETLFDQFETPLIVGWQLNNLLIEIMLMQGFLLDSRVVPLEAIQRNTVQRVRAEAIAHELFVCLDEQINDETIQNLHLRPEDIFVCLDSALSDEAKIRLADQCNLKVI